MLKVQIIYPAMVRDKSVAITCVLDLLFSKEIFLWQQDSRYANTIIYNIGPIDNKEAEKFLSLSEVKQYYSGVYYDAGVNDLKALLVS